MKESTYKKYCLVIDEWFVNGFNGTKAYQKFYPEASDESADSSFREIVGISRIQEYKRSKQENTSNRLQITLEGQLLELDDLKSLSKDDKRYNEAISAVKEQNKLLGFYEEHNNQRHTDNKKDYSKLTDEELIALSELERKANS